RPPIPESRIRIGATAGGSTTLTTTSSAPVRNRVSTSTVRQWFAGAGSGAAHPLATIVHPPTPAHRSRCLPTHSQPDNPASIDAERARIATADSAGYQPAGRPLP